MNECVKCVTSQYKCVEDDFEMAIDRARQTLKLDGSTFSRIEISGSVFNDGFCANSFKPILLQKCISFNSQGTNPIDDSICPKM